MAKPRIPITDPRFVYRNSQHTDVSETFRRARMRDGRAASAARKVEPKPAVNVLPIKKATGGRP